MLQSHWFVSKDLKFVTLFHGLLMYFLVLFEVYPVMYLWQYSAYKEILASLLILVS